MAVKLKRTNVPLPLLAARKQERLSDELVRFIKSEILDRTAKHSETARALDPRPHLKLDSV
ncbi:MAG: hypothetical protein ABW197_04285 [Methyloceanibacter sp.]